MRSLTGANFLYNEIKTAWSLNQAVLIFLFFRVAFGRETKGHVFKDIIADV